MIFRDPNPDWPCPTCGEGAIELKTDPNSADGWEVLSFTCLNGHTMELKATSGAERIYGPTQHRPVHSHEPTGLWRRWLQRILSVR